MMELSFILPETTLGQDKNIIVISFYVALISSFWLLISFISLASFKKLFVCNSFVFFPLDHITNFCCFLWFFEFIMNVYMSLKTLIEEWPLIIFSVHKTWKKFLKNVLIIEKFISEKYYFKIIQRCISTHGSNTRCTCGKAAGRTWNCFFIV